MFYVQKVALLWIISQLKYCEAVAFVTWDWIYLANPSRCSVVRADTKRYQMARSTWCVQWGLLKTAEGCLLGSISICSLFRSMMKASHVHFRRREGRRDYSVCVVVPILCSSSKVEVRQFVGHMFMHRFKNVKSFIYSF